MSHDTTVPLLGGDKTGHRVSEIIVIINNSHLYSAISKYNIVQTRYSIYINSDAKGTVVEKVCFEIIRNKKLFFFVKSNN